MITEDKILRLYQDAVERGHPDPGRAVFGRLSITDGDIEYDKDGQVGVFGVSKKLADSIGLAEIGNIDASFEAMMHFDGVHINQEKDDSAGMAKTAGVSDVDAYRRKLDDGYQEYRDNRLLWEGGKPIGFKQSPETIEVEDPLGAAETPDDVRDASKRAVADNATESRKRVALGIAPDPQEEYDRLAGVIKSVLETFAEQ